MTFEEGVEVEVIDPRSESVAKTGRLLIVDEDYGPCGIGAEIAAQVANRGFNDLDAPIRRLNTLHAPIPYSPPLEQAAWIVSRITVSVRRAEGPVVDHPVRNAVRRGHGSCLRSHAGDREDGAEGRKLESAEEDDRKDDPPHGGSRDA